MSEQQQAPRRPEPYAPFRPVTGAWVGRIMAVLSVVVFGLVALLAPAHINAPPELDTLNRVLIFLVGLAMGGFLWRYALIRAIPSPQGLRVVNLVRSRDLEWAQILRVGFAQGGPWAVLELTDTEEVAVMAIQRADGERARREAARLAALIQHHSSGPESPGDLG